MSTMPIITHVIEEHLVFHVQDGNFGEEREMVMSTPNDLGHTLVRKVSFREKLLPVQGHSSVNITVGL